MARLGDVGKVITGNTPKTSDSQNYASNDICFVKPSDIAAGGVAYLNDSEFYISEYARAKARILPPKSVLVTCIGIIGKVAINNIECAFNQQINAVVPDESKCLTEYLAYAIQNKQPEMQDAANAPVVPILNKTQFSDIEINLPSLTEQKEIIEKLDAVSQLIALRKEQLEKLDELVKSRFVELIVGKGYPVIPVKNLLVQNSTVEKISDTKAEKFVTVGIKGRGARQRVIKDGKWPVPFSGYRVKQGQFIYSRIDARNGAFAILPEEVDNAVVSKDFPVFDIKIDKIQPSILLFSVLQDDFVRQIQNSSFGATNRQRIQEDVFGEYTITLPPMEVQNHFATFVEQVDKSKLAIQESLAELETLKKALMQKYFG